MQYIRERYAIDPDLHILIVANTFHGIIPNFGGSSQKRLHRTNDLLNYIEAEFPKASIYFSCDKMTKNGTGRHPINGRDPLYFNSALLQRPTTASWPQTTWHWDNQWLGNNNVFDDANPQGHADFRIHPPYSNDTLARNKFYINISVPSEHRDKWVEMKFRVHYSNPSRRWAISSLTAYPIIDNHPELNETIRTIWGILNFSDFQKPYNTNGNRRTGSLPTTTNVNYSYWDNVQDIDYITVRFHTRYSRYTIRVDYSWDGGVSSLAPGADPWSQGYVYIKNFTIGDSYILDDANDGGMTSTSYMRSFDGTTLAQTRYTVDPNYWVQLWSYGGSWTAPFHHDETQDHVKNCISNVITYFGNRIQFKGFFFESDELYFSGWDPDVPEGWSCAKGFAHHYAEISKYIYERNPAWRAYMYADLANPGHGGKLYYRANNPANGGFQNVLSYFKEFGGKKNVVWIDWGGLSPSLYQQTVTYFDSMALPWALGYCRDQTQWSEEGMSGWPLVTALIRDKTTSVCIGGAEFGFHKFYEVRNEPMHQTTLNNLTTLAGFQKADTSKRLSQKLVILPYNP